jgi:L-methionine (R)-S-oxide reductase
MEKPLNLPQTASKKEMYEALLPQLTGLVEGEPDLIANLANISAGLKEALGCFWVGFYLVKGGNLVLGPFQGPLACTRISYGKGVCGAAWKTKETQLVPDVEDFPGHIACSAATKSEIVVPVMKEGKVVMVLDIDSDKLATFDETDQHYLEKLARVLLARL